MCEGAGPKAKTTIEYLHRSEDGSVFKVNADFVSEAQYGNWLKLNGGRSLFKVPRNMTENLQLLLTLEEVKNAAASTDCFLLLETPTKFASVQDVKELMASINNRARAIEVKTTRSIGSNKSVKDQYGELQLINNGESVKFYPKDSSHAYVECDGLIKTADGVLLLNEVKASPKEYDFVDVLTRVEKMDFILKDIQSFISVPPLAVEMLGGIKQVVPFLSGCDFPSELVEKCRTRGINAVETNGIDYSVKLCATQTRDK
jgi:hypothetical protein